MKMIYKFCLLGMLGAFLFTGCYDDKGNYDYRLINEVTVEHEFFGDTILRMYAFVDTLRITPEIKGSIDGDIDNYEFEWVAAGDNFDKKGVYTIGLGKDLEYPITLPAQSYRIFYNVKDKKTGLIKSETVDLRVATMFSQGWLVLGEGDEGKAQLDMVATGGGDTTVLKNLLQASEIHEELGEPKLVFVPPFRPTATLNYIIVSTSSGTYRLDPETLLPIDGTHLKWSYYDVSAAGMCVMTDVVQVMGYFRTMVVDNELYYSYLMGSSGCFLSGASNHYRGNYSLFPFGDKIGYGPKERSYTVVMYNKEKGSFVYQTYGSGPNQYFDDLTDKSGDIFSWQPGYDYVTTVNTLMGNGYTYTILQDEDDFYLYSYRISYSFGVLKQLAVKMDNVIDMDKAEFFGGSNTLSVIFYTVGNKLYGYDFAKKKGELLETFDGYEITLLQSDILVQTSGDYFYVALYDPTKPTSTGGEIRKYTIVDDVNDIVIEEERGSRWQGVCKVKSISYKAK